jgi:hypothetical protein
LLWFSVKRRWTVSRDRLSWSVSLTIAPANSCSVQRARPSGGLEQAVAMRRRPRFVLEFSQALTFRERASASVFGYDPDIGQGQCEQLADTVERRRCTFDFLHELLNRYAGKIIPKPMAPTLSRSIRDAVCRRVRLRTNAVVVRLFHRIETGTVERIGGNSRAKVAFAPRRG